MCEILKLTEDHIDSLLDLESICFSKPWSKGMFLGDITNPNTAYFVAVDCDKVVGYCGMWLVYPEGQITNIAVHPDYRRNGIATKLLNKLFETCKANDFTSITLEVRESNKEALAFYDKMEFLQVGKRKNYYKNPVEDALLMTKTF